MLENIKTERFTFCEIVSNSWEIVKTRFAALFSLTVIIGFPVAFFSCLCGYLYGCGYFPGATAAGFISSLLGAVIYVLLVMAIAVVVEKTIEGENIAYGAALRESYSRWLDSLGTSLLAGIIIFLLLLLFIIPGIIWGVYYAFFLYVVALRGIAGKKALDYSKALVKGEWRRVFLYFFGFGVLTGLPVVVINAICALVLPDLLLGTVVVQVLLAAVSLAVYTFYCVAAAVFFLNLDYLKAAEQVKPIGLKVIKG